MQKNYTEFGNQAFDPGITIKEIANCLQEWNSKNVEQFNTITKQNGGYRIAPSHLTGDGVKPEKVTEMWKWIQSMDIPAYDTMNHLLMDIMELLVPPPPPPDPPND